MRMRGVVWLAAVLSAGCATAPLHFVSPDGSRLDAIHLDAWLSAHPLAADQEIRIDELGRSASASYHLVQIRAKEPPHVHRTHDALARLERGRGTFVLGSHRLALLPGSVVNIPRNVPHQFVNESVQPAVAFVVFSPPLDSADYVPVSETKTLIVPR